MSQTALTKQQKKEFAEILYCNFQLDQKVVAVKVGVSPTTMNKWANDPRLNWEKKRKRLLIGREQQLTSFYDQLDALNKFISSRGEGKNFPNSKEADAQNKLTGSIRDLELELSIADKIGAIMDFIKWIQKTSTTEKAIELTTLGDAFIRSLVK